MNVCVRKCLHREVNVCEDVCCCICYEINVDLFVYFSTINLP